MGMSKEFEAYEKELLAGHENLNHIKPNDPRLKKLRELAEPKKAEKKKSTPDNKAKKKVKVKAIHRGVDFLRYEDVEWKKIEDARKSKTLSQIQMGDILRLKNTVYHKYESGTLRVPLKNLKKIAKALNVELVIKKGDSEEEMKVMYRNVRVDLIKKKRERFGLSLIQTAKGAGVSAPYLTILEKSDKAWNGKMLEKVCDFLDLDFDEVKGDEGEVKGVYKK